MQVLISNTEADISCFPSPGDWSMVSLCLQHPLCWFSWLPGAGFQSCPQVRLVSSSSILLYPLFGVRVLRLSLPTVVHVCYFSHSISFLSPTLGAKFVLCFFPLSCFSTWITVSLLTLYCTFYHVRHGFLLENQDQDTRKSWLVMADLFWIFVVDSSANIKNSKHACGLWHSWKNMFLQFFEGMMTLLIIRMCWMFLWSKSWMFYQPFLRNIPNCYVFSPFCHNTHVNWLKPCHLATLNHLL